MASVYLSVSRFWVPIYKVWNLAENFKLAVESAVVTVRPFPKEPLKFWENAKEGKNPIINRNTIFFKTFILWLEIAYIILLGFFLSDLRANV